MIISDKGRAAVNSVYLQTLRSREPVQRENSVSGETTPERDEVGISAEAKALQKAAGTVDSDEPVRWDRVAELRQRISKGEYEVPVTELARRLIADV